MPVEKIINKIIEIIQNFLPSDYKIILFGSFAKGNALSSSDIDIGIFGEKKVPWNVMARILDKVDQIPTLRSIDVIDLNAKNETFKNEVLKYAKILK